VRAMVSAENRPFITALGDEAALAEALATLAGNADLRGAVGAANRALAVAQYDEAGMVERYRAIYGAACGLDRFG